jgi:hypothetical protein
MAIRKITIETIEHHEQRYDTAGDWQIDDATEHLRIKVSDIGDWHYNMLIAFHEMIEALLCHDRGISEKMVDDFDMAYEAKRDVGDTSEPGNDPESPYFNEHFFATTLERLLAREFEIGWPEYEQEFDKLER